MRSLRNRNVIFTGKVGSRARLPIRKWYNRRIYRFTTRLQGGPLDGAVVRLDKTCGNHTLPITLRGQAGQYVNSEWLPQRRAAS